MKDRQSLKLNFTILPMVSLDLDIIPKMKTEQHAAPFPDTAVRRQIEASCLHQGLSNIKRGSGAGQPLAIWTSAHKLPQTVVSNSPS